MPKLQEQKHFRCQNGLLSSLRWNGVHREGGLPFSGWMCTWEGAQGGLCLGQFSQQLYPSGRSNALCPMPPLHKLGPTQPCRQSSQGNKQPYGSPCAGLLSIIGFSHWHPKFEALRAAKIAGCSTWSCVHRSTFPVFLQKYTQLEV